MKGKRKPGWCPCCGTMQCPSCGARMDQIDHGKCPICKKYCGCSFNPTSNSDWCEEHGTMACCKHPTAIGPRINPPKEAHVPKPSKPMTPKRAVREAVRQVNIPLLKSAAWLVQRLCWKTGEPCDGFRFRDGILAIKKALGKGYVPSGVVLSFPHSREYPKLKEAKHGRK